jgi:Tol biopolymer transport system component/predicted Ser/Thr protein kinase
MPITTGDRLGPYEILALIGKGGMGEVYRARDTKLKRNVALKVLPDAFARDPDRMARFQREAEVLASLNHPNIAHIYGVEDRALVMELIEGQTLPSPLPLDTALNYAKQIAEALEYAHERGVIHRDLKPANVKVTPEGVVKLLDFGLAKAIEDQAVPRDDPSNSPTLTLSATNAGVIMGTAGYMSPEQASGKPVDRRADIWSFGAVLYEMLSGKRAFAGESASDILATVLKLDPDWDALPASAPASIRKLIRRCLTKDRKQRLQAIGEARIVLEDPVAEPAVALPIRQRAPWFAIAPWIAAALFAAVAGVALWAPWRTPPEAQMVTTTILPPEGAAFDFSNSRNPPAISPDGRRLVFGARSADGRLQLWVRSLNSRTAQPLAGTESARFAFWSPDSKSIGFFAGGKLKTINAAGSPPLTVANAPVGHGGSWSPEGIIVFAPDEGESLQRILASGGTAVPATTLNTAEGRSHRAPWFLPDGRHFLFENLLRGTNDISIQVASLDSKETKTVARASSNAVYADGRLLFLRENTLMAQPFDAKRLATTGDAVPVAEQIGQATGDAVGLFSAASTGLLTYQAGAGVGGTRLTWFDRSGKRAGTLGDAGDYRTLEFSPDRKSLAASVVDASGNQDLWIYDVARGLRTRFTFDPGLDDDPLWSPDGRSIAFRSNRKGHFDLYRKSSDGAGAEELLYADNFEKTPGNWSPDGKFLLFRAADPKTGTDIWVLPLSPQQTGTTPKPSLFLQTAFNLDRPRFSPDGRWVAYQSNESQQAEIYVAPFPGRGGKRQISTSGGFLPRWRPDGKEIFYLGPGGRLMAAEMNIKDSMIEVGQVRPLGIPVLINGHYLYDVSADGQRFLVAAAPEQKADAPLTLVQNWAAGLKK